MARPVGVRVSGGEAPPAVVAAGVSRWLLLLTLTVYVTTAGGSLTTTDAVVTFDLTEQLVEHQELALSGNLLGLDSMRGRDGRYYSPFGIGQSLFNIPFYLAGRAAANVTGLRFGDADAVPKAVVALSQTLVATAIVALTFRLAVLVTGDVWASGVAALILAFGSVLWPYSKFGFNQPLACMTLLAACLQAVAVGYTRSLSAAAWSGAWLAASVLCRHEMVIAAVPVGCWLAFGPDGSSRDRTRRVLAFVPGLSIGIGLWMALNLWRFGNPFDPGLLRDPTPGFGSSPDAGVLGLLFSPGASLFIYSPMAAAGLVGLARLFRRDRAIAVLLGSLVLVFVGFFATMGNWLGGRAYGSRYLVVILPYLAVGVAAILRGRSGRRRLLAAVLLTVGVTIQLPGVLLDYSKVSESRAREHGAFSTEERQWTWEASSLVLNSRAAIEIVPANVRFILGVDDPPRIARAEQERGFGRQFEFSLDFWWLYLFYARAFSRAMLLLVLAGFVVSAWWSAANLQAALSRSPS